jgi:hypothetical protein
MEAILAAGHILATMEQLTPGDVTAWENIQRWIDDSDGFILILGGRYGSIEPTSGKSYTQLEYDYALSKGKPFFSLVMTDAYLQKRIEEIGFARADERVNQEMYRRFKASVTQILYRPFNDEKDIQAAIYQKFPEWAQREDLSGWIRAEDAVSPELANELAILSTENRDLREKVKAFEDKTRGPVDDIIFEIVINPEYGSSKPAQFSYLQRRATSLRYELERAALEERRGMRIKLAEILKMQLQVCPHQHPEPHFQALHKAVIEEIEHLRARDESERQKHS